jgi:hypothetical protein
MTGAKHKMRPTRPPAGSKLAPMRSALTLRRPLLPSWGELRTLATTPAGSLLLTCASAVVIGLALVAKPILIAALIALAIGAFGLYISLTRPALAFGLLVAVLGLIPTYASPTVGSILFDPGAAACLVIGVVLMWENTVIEGRPLRVNYVDLAAALFLALMFVSIFFSPRVAPSDFWHTIFLWIGPYLAARVLLARVDRPARVAAISFAIVALILAPIALAESLGASNPFFNLNFNSGEFAVWNSQLSRFGEIRSATSFAHPIAFSMFLAASALLSFAQGLAADSDKPRLIWYGITAITIAEMSLTISRTGWVMVGIGALLFGLVSLRGPYRRQILTLLLLGIGVFVVLAAVDPAMLSKLPGFSNSGEATYAASGQYREALLHRALQPGVLHAWGNAQNEITAGVGLDSTTDNAYVILADLWGLIPTFALITVGVAVLITGLRPYPNEKMDATAILPIVAFTSLVAIFFVAFISQQQCFIWLLVGAGGAAAERARFGQPSRAFSGEEPSTAGSRNTGRGSKRSAWQPARSVDFPSG